MELRKATWAFVLLSTVYSVVPAQGLGSSAEALKVIGDFADRLCQTVPLDTSSSRVELSGSAKAELDGIVKKLANLGIQGAGKYESSDSKNVLQKDLAEVLKESRNCRLQVWNDLKTKFDLGAAATPKVCRHSSHGIERYAREFDVTRSSHFMGGGFDQPRWCTQAIGQLRGEHPGAEFQVLGSNENKRDTCSPFNCPQYQYHCTIKVRADPVFVERASTACR
jgi:hypothetical protein